MLTKIYVVWLNICDEFLFFKKEKAIVLKF